MTQIIASKANALNGSRTFVQFGQAGLKTFEREAIEACKFVYNLTGQHTGEPYNQLAFCIGQMVKDMVSAMKEKAAQSAVGGADIVNRMRDEMESKRHHLLADFRNGMMGSERLKKDPVVSIVANQTNSPGGIQQVGVGDFSQNAFIENHQKLIDAVNEALTSPEYQKLGAEQKDAFKDGADTLLEEVKKDKPDPGKLKRWGDRLVALAKELGLHVAATAIFHIMTGIFPAG